MANQFEIQGKTEDKRIKNRIHKGNKWDRRFLELAKHISLWSKDPSTKCGAVIVRQDRTIASIGFNGFPMDMYDNIDNYNSREEKYGRIIHAEMNALIHAKESVRGCTLYTWPMQSCNRCMVHMIQAGIERFVAPRVSGETLERWKDSFKKTQEYANECGRKIELIDIDLGE